MDIPSDADWGVAKKYHKGDLHPESDAYRISDKQEADYRAVMKELKSQGVKKFFLVSYSRSGMSNVNLAARLGKEISGIVLVSSIQTPGFLDKTDFSKIKVPALFITHEKDGCNLNEFGEAAYSAFLLNQHTKVKLVRTTGGEADPQADPCIDPKSYHGFPGTADQVVNIIIDWIKAQP
jgi:hypothetical protein